MRSVGPWVVVCVILTACGEIPAVDGLDVTVREGAADPAGPLERCAVLTVTERPLTLDRVAFEADEMGVTPRVHAWTDVAVSGTTELCFFVCACQAGEIGHFIVDDDGERSAADVDWPADRCCEAAPDAGR